MAPDPVRSAPLFLTGASGFVGARLLRQLAQAGHSEVRLLVRNPARLRSGPPLPRGWRILVGELADPAPWSAHLRGVETVLHLAAATGKVPRRTHFAVTVEGTRRLLAEAERAGVRRFLFVSSIAVCYRDRPHYHYAEAKAAAEELVRAARLDWLLVRPTLVLGPGSPLLASLRRLALLPRPVVFGNGRQLIQPIHVDDLAGLLVAALSLPEWQGTVLTAAGPQAVSIEELLGRLRSRERSGPGRFLHLPIAPVRRLLALLEPLLLSALPFTAGQLAFFANPSLPPSDPLPAGLPHPALGLEAMLAGDPAA